MRKCLMASLVAAVLSVCGASSADAQGYYPGWGNGGLTYQLYASERLPFYALHPPVYYGLPSVRSYGQSPFAYTPNFSEQRAPRSRRFVSSQALTQPVEMLGNEPPVFPILIKNPFVN